MGGTRFPGNSVTCPKISSLQVISKIASFYQNAALINADAPEAFADLDVSAR
jgi:hypothetical protein